MASSPSKHSQDDAQQPELARCDTSLYERSKVDISDEHHTTSQSSSFPNVSGAKKYIDLSSSNGEENANEVRESSERAKLHENEIDWILCIYPRDLIISGIHRTHRVSSSVPFDTRIHNDGPMGKNVNDQRKENHREGPILSVCQNVVDGSYTRDGNGRPFVLTDLRILKVMATRLEVKSELLRRTLDTIIGYYPQYAEASIAESFRVAEPYPVLMHHYKQINSAVSDGEDLEATHDVNSEITGKARSQLRVLLRFLQPFYKGSIQRCEGLLKGKIPTAEFDTIWYIYRPGMDVYIQSEDGVFAAVVRQIVYEEDRIEPMADRTCLDIEVFCLDTDGWRMGRSKRYCRIIRYAGMVKLVSLPICPAEVWDAHDGGKRRASILKRNNTLLRALLQGSMFMKLNSREHSGRVIIDHVTGWSLGNLDILPTIGIHEDSFDQFRRYDGIVLREVSSRGHQASEESADYQHTKTPGPLENLLDDRSKPPGRPSRKVSQAKSNKAPRASFPNAGSEDETAGQVQQSDAAMSLKQITEHQLLLLFPLVPAFILASKTWTIANIEYMEEIQASNESIENLVIDRGVLQTIRALSMRQDRQSRIWSADFIEGKGAGQIILLHGPPGTGKTYTVESISAWLGRPLVALTVGDIGTTETRIEQELMRWFDLAESWNAILLVDEADIFLEQRRTRDLSRNGLVSAFLRRMEYFRGLLFLTTNRVGQIDDAFMSRVHVAIGYEKLNVDVRRKIWKGFFNKLARERAGEIKVGAGAKRYVLESSEVAAIQLNGREIRNALQNAITLAEYEATQAEGEEEDGLVIVEESHFRQVLQMNEKFQKYVTTIRREDEAKRASARGDRNDYYT